MDNILAIVTTVILIISLILFIFLWERFKNIERYLANISSIEYAKSKYAYPKEVNGRVTINGEGISYEGAIDEGIMYIWLTDGRTTQIKVLHELKNCMMKDENGKYTILADNLEDAIVKEFAKE